MSYSAEFSPNLSDHQETEWIRRSCTDHGDYYADQLLAVAKLQELVLTGMDAEQLGAAVAGSPDLEKAYSDTIAIVALDEHLQDARTGLRPVLADVKTTHVNPYADILSDRVIQMLGHRPDLFNVQQATMTLALQTALINCKLPKSAPAAYESALVNQFANALLAKMDPDMLCHVFGDRDDEAMQLRTRAQIEKLCALFETETGAQINSEFFLSKALSIRASINSAIRLHELKGAMLVPEVDTNTLQELKAKNTAFAKQIQRIQAFGVKSLVFPFGDVIPGYDAVFHSFKTIGQTVFGEQPMALIQMVPDTLPSEMKLDKTIETKEVASGMMRIKVGALHPIIVIDSQGELFSGSSPNQAIPLRTLFEQEGRGTAYEAFRGGLLSNMFDAIAPATVVDRLEEEIVPRSEQSDRPAVRPTDVISRLGLPRMRYLQSRNAKGIKKDFEAALAEEATQQSVSSPSSRRWHHLEGFTRNLPKTAKGPGKTAIANAKACFGEDYELPPGKTFVGEHSRGNIELGAVAGHLVMKHVAEGT